MNKPFKATARCIVFLRTYEIFDEADGFISTEITLGEGTKFMINRLFIGLKLNQVDRISLSRLAYFQTSLG